jgi:hypothetical protein
MKNPSACLQAIHNDAVENAYFHREICGGNFSLMNAPE